MSHYYVLDAEGRPKPEDNILRWADWFEQASRNGARTVDRTEIGEVAVSTVFLGTDHNFLGAGRPLLYETMIFGGRYDSHMWRYSTRLAAQQGHDRVVAALQAGTHPEEET